MEVDVSTPSNSKQSVSLRLNASDLDRVQAVAERLGVRTSDVFRFAIKVGLAKLAPLDDESIQGRALLPVFIDNGREIAEHFDLDSRTLAHILNGGIEGQDDMVDPADIELIALSGLQDTYLQARLMQLTKKPLGPNGPQAALRRYLHAKYVEGLDIDEMVD